ncbi:ABC transporter substrate-binding protein [Rhodoferax sp.]|uniref:ABC transporter substrate-binding protein n=1 Tax=Rhodoferax sp. TaxID=50421 RepID=UPI0025E8D935|nr:ABC transporter substrate-binding protein [Rhodoferax sp.]
MRSNFTLLALALAATYFSGAAAADAPKVAQKAAYKVGFAQTESNNPWRLAETKSFQDVAASCGWQVIFTDAGGSAAKQVADIDSLIAQKVDLLVFPPREDKPLIPAVMKAKKAGIPVILVDRDVDHKLAKPGVDYITFIGSDFIDQGRRAADALVKATGGKANIIELEGSTGASAATDRKKGFDAEIAKHPGMKIVASQSGDFNRDKGRQLAQTLLQAHPEANAVYGHNDEMAVGAITAIEAAGKVPGKDIFVVSIDGQRNALDAIIAGKMVATVQSSPYFGGISCKIAQASAKGEKIPAWVKVEDKIYDISNAAKDIAEGF